MLRSCFRPLERCFGRLGGGDGLLWHLDLKPYASDDFSIGVVKANSSLEDQGQNLTKPSVTYIDVYDSHGGPEASRFVNSRLFPLLHKFASEQGGVPTEVIKKVFDATEEFLQIVTRLWLSRPQITSVGSHCLMGAITEDMVYVANLGDSRAVLGCRGGDGRSVVAERLTNNHNVVVEEIRRELTALHSDDAHIVVYNRGAWRIKRIIQLRKPLLSL